MDYVYTLPIIDESDLPRSIGAIERMLCQPLVHEIPLQGLDVFQSLRMIYETSDEETMIYETSDGVSMTIDGVVVMMGDKSIVELLERVLQSEMNMPSTCPFFLGYVSSGTTLQFIAVRARGNTQPLLRPFDLCKSDDRAEFEMCLLNLAPFLPAYAEAKKYRERTHGVTIEFNRESVIKRVNMDKADWYDVVFFKSFYGDYSKMREAVHSLPRIDCNFDDEEKNMTLIVSPVLNKSDTICCVEGVRQMIKDVLTALAALHENGYVHRDVRLANIMDDGKNFYLIDFEMAGRVGDAVTWKQTAEAVVSDECATDSWQCRHDLQQLGKSVDKLVGLNGVNVTKDIARFIGRLKFAKSGTMAKHLLDEFCAICRDRQ